jgi:DNA invertase Pin-like site-specific DNA recombinase
MVDSGKSDGESIINQQEMLEQYVGTRPELNLKKVFVDNGETGVDFIRPAWNDLMRECRTGKINCVVVKDLSRVGRNYIETGELLDKIFPLLGVRVIAVNDGYDNINLTTGEQLVANLKNLVNDIYSKDISRKVSASALSMRKQGLFNGAYPMYGYLKDPADKHKIIVDPETAPIVRQIFGWKADGLGSAAIARKLNEAGILSPNTYRFRKGIVKNPKYEQSLWSIPNITSILRSPMYLGHMTQGKSTKSIAEGKTTKKRVAESDWVIVENRCGQTNT